MAYSISLSRRNDGSLIIVVVDYQHIHVGDMCSLSSQQLITKSMLDITIPPFSVFIDNFSHEKSE